MGKVVGIAVEGCSVIDTLLGDSVGVGEVFLVCGMMVWDGALVAPSSNTDKLLVISIEMTLSKLSFWCKQLMKYRRPPEAKAYAFDITALIVSSGMDWFE